MCSDGAMVNRSVYNLLHNEFGEQYLCILCMSHKFELSINLTSHKKQIVWKHSTHLCCEPSYTRTHSSLPGFKM